MEGEYIPFLYFFFIIDFSQLCHRFSVFAEMVNFVLFQLRKMTAFRMARAFGTANAILNNQIELNSQKLDGTFEFLPYMEFPFIKN